MQARKRMPALAPPVAMVTPGRGFGVDKEDQ